MADDGWTRVQDAPTGNDGWTRVQDAPISGLQKGAGDVARGVLNVGAAVADLPVTGWNLLKAGAGTIQGLTTGQPPNDAYDPTPGPAATAVDRGLTAIGLPDYQPGNFFEDFLKRMTQYTAGAMTSSAAITSPRVPINLSQQSVQSVPQAMVPKTAPGSMTAGTAVAPAVSALGGSTVNAVMPNSPVAQTFGEVAPSLLTGGVRPGNPAQVKTEAQLKADAIREAGGNPTVNQTTGGALANWVEGVGGRSPGGDIATVANARATNAGMGARVKELASNISDATAPTQAGNAVQSGIDKFVVGFKTRFLGLNAEVAKHFSSDEGVPITNYLAKLDEMIGRGQGADESLTAMSGSERGALLRLRQSALNDSANIAVPEQPAVPSRQEKGPMGMGNISIPEQPAVPAQLKPGMNAGEMEYQGLRDLRSLAGQKGASSGLKDDISRGTYKALYGALTDDLMAAAQAKGPEAVKALSNQNKFYKAGMVRIDDVLQPLASKNTPEAAYTAAISGSDKGATTLHALRQSLPTADWSDFVSTFVDRMGKANPGNQSAEGDVWSAQKFLTDWNKLSPQAKNELFGSRETPKLRENLDTVAQAADSVSKSGGMYANPSGSAKLGANAATGIAFGTAVAGLHLKTAGGIAAAVIGNYAIQKGLMTNPKFVDWLAKGKSIPADKLPAYAGRLMAIGEKEGNDEMKQFATQLTQ